MNSLQQVVLIRKDRVELACRRHFLNAEIFLLTSSLWRSHKTVLSFIATHLWSELCTHPSVDARVWLSFLLKKVRIDGDEWRLSCCIPRISIG
jgi:hypothetical protein